MIEGTEPEPGTLYKLFEVNPMLTSIPMTLDGTVVIPDFFFDRELLRAIEDAEATVEEAVLLRVVGTIVCLLGDGNLEGDNKLETCEVLGKLEIDKRKKGAEKAKLHAE